MMKVVTVFYLFELPLLVVPLLKQILCHFEAKRPHGHVEQIIERVGNVANARSLALFFFFGLKANDKLRFKARCLSNQE